MIVVMMMLFWLATRSGGEQADNQLAQDAPAREGSVHHITPTAAPEPVGDGQQSDASDRIGRATRGVLGSKHDFSKLTGRTVDACGACHVPHVQAVRPDSARQEPFALAFYRLGGQREVLIPSRYMPGPTSLLCLSCHNGAAAASTVASSHVLLSVHRSGFEVGEFSTRDHPIGIEYPTRQKGYRARAQVLNAGIPLPKNRLECVSCHDPHNAAGTDKMLVMPNRRSALCLSCHEK